MTMAINLKPYLAGWFAWVPFVVISCTSPISPVLPAVTVTNNITYNSNTQPMVGAQSQVYLATIALMNTSSNTVYEFTMISNRVSPNSPAAPGTYLLAWRAWTNIGTALTTNTWSVSNTVTLRNFSNYTLRIDTSATNQVHFAEQPGNTVITVLEY